MSAASPSPSRRRPRQDEPEEWDPSFADRDASGDEPASEAAEAIWDAAKMIRQWMAAGAATAAQTAARTASAGASIVKQAGGGVMRAAMRHRRGGSRGKGQQPNGILDWRGKANAIRGVLGMPPLKRPWKHKASHDVFVDEMRRLKRKGQLPRGYKNWQDPNERKTKSRRQVKNSERPARDYKAGPKGFSEEHWKKLDKIIVEIRRSKDGDLRALAAQQRSEATYLERRDANRPNGRDRSLLALSLAAEDGDPEAQEKLDRLIGNKGRRVDHERQTRSPKHDQESQPEQESELQKRQENRELLRKRVADEAELEWCKDHPLLGKQNTIFMDMEKSEIVGCKKGRVIAGNWNTTDATVAADEILKFSGENSDKRHKEIGHLIVSWHDERQAHVGDEQRRWACRAALAARGIDPERHKWVAVEHKEDRRIHLVFAKSRDDGARWQCDFPQQTSILSDAVADRLCTGRTRPDEDAPSSGRIHERGDEALAKMQRGEGEFVKFVKRDGKIEQVKMDGASIARRLADQAGIPPPEATETGGAMSLPKHSIPACDAQRFCKYAMG